MDHINLSNDIKIAIFLIQS